MSLIANQSLATVSHNSRQKILVYRIGNLGDTIISLPAMWAVRKHFANAHLTLLGNSNGRHVVARDVLPAIDLFDEWLIYLSGAENQPTAISFDLLKLLVKLRLEKFDALVYLAPRGRTAAHVRRDLLFFRLAGIKRFIGHTGFVPVPAKRAGEALPAVEHEADHLLERIRLSGVETPAAGLGSMDLRLTERENQAARSWLVENCGKAFYEKRLVGIGAGSKWSSKIWFEKRFAELGRRLIGELDLFPVIFGGEEDRATAERLLQIWARGANAAGQLKIREAAAALQHCSIYVGNDTGTMHLAAAVKTPCVGIFSALDWRNRWYPYGSGHEVLRETVPCEGCLLFECPNDNLCLRMISVAAVFNACQKIIEKPTQEFV